jgi:hypothetical protein
MRIAPRARQHRGDPSSSLTSVDGRAAPCWHPAVRFAFFLVLFAASLLYAVIRGGAPERITALLLLSAWLLTFEVSSPVQGRFTHVEIGIFLVDLGLFVALYALSLFTTRFWPIWMSGMQGVSVLVHCAILVPSVTGFAYATMEQFWSYPMSLLLIVATRRHRLRLTRTGTDDPWVSFFAPSGRAIPS